ncbi:hypothetical protein AALP_AAs71392U000100 [Arabis alpina]|uniref:Uncharacterized protein n=1 Tax=Arabis alpina TaxID=50452 RepID=A0A087G3L3_ARAAL|nr:hypothetical protein AALP_AAs71392U000100 [Arabis alpina]
MSLVKLSLLSVAVPMSKPPDLLKTNSPRPYPTLSDPLQPLTPPDPPDPPDSLDLPSRSVLMTLGETLCNSAVRFKISFHPSFDATRKKHEPPEALLGVRTGGVSSTVRHNPSTVLCICRLPYLSHAPKVFLCRDEILGLKNYVCVLGHLVHLNLLKPMIQRSIWYATDQQLLRSTISSVPERSLPLLFSFMERSPYSFLERSISSSSSLLERTILPTYSFVEYVFKRSALMVRANCFVRTSSLAKELALLKVLWVITYDCSLLSYLYHVLYFNYALRSDSLATRSRLSQLVTAF